MIDLSLCKEGLERSINRAKKQGIIIPTFEQLKSPDRIPPEVKANIAKAGMWNVTPMNLFRISWKNEPRETGGGYAGVNYLEFPSKLTGVEARIIALTGKWFPTGCHKVGAAYGCLVPRLVTGQFDPTKQKAVWPSTGNYCRGGAYVSALLGCDSIAILPEEMSRERFDWLSTIAGEIIKTPGSESNVKEIFDKCWQLKESGRDLMVFNQFEEFGNYLWHFQVTGQAMTEVLESELGSKDALRGLVLATGSAGSLASGDYLKLAYPGVKIGVAEAWQCPTLLENGFGEHRIEGIGDKHVPWIHNVLNTDVVFGIDDAAILSLARLFNEREGQSYLLSTGVPESTVSQLHLLGFSGICNLISAIKFARYFELGNNDVVLTVLTDSMELYQSRLAEMQSSMGGYNREDAAGDHSRYLKGLTTDHLDELTYPERRRVHNLKYFTWVEQQGRSGAELREQWYAPDYWSNVQKQLPEIDALIEEFNAHAGVMV